MENENEIKSLVESVLRDQEAIRKETESKSADEAKIARMEKGMADAQEQIKSLQLDAQRSAASDAVEEAKSESDYSTEFKNWMASADATEIEPRWISCIRPALHVSKTSSACTIFVCCAFIHTSH